MFHAVANVIYDSDTSKMFKKTTFFEIRKIAKYTLSNTGKARLCLLKALTKVTRWRGLIVSPFADVDARLATRPAYV